MSKIDPLLGRIRTIDEERIVENVVREIHRSGSGGVQSVRAGTNIDIDTTDSGSPIVSVEPLTLSDITDIVASATEVNYMDGVTSSVQTQIDGKVSDTAYAASWNGVTTVAPSKNAVYDKIASMPELSAGTDTTITTGGGFTSVNVGTSPIRRTEYDAQTVLAATANDTPLALTIGEGQVLGRLSGGNVKSVTMAELSPLIFDDGGARTCDPRLVETTLTAVANRAYYGRNLTGQSLSVSSLMTFQGASSGNVCVAVYSNTGTGRAAQPLNRLATSGSVASAGTGQVTYNLGSTITINPGDWLYVCADNTTVTFGRLNIGALTNFDGWAWQQASAFPAPLTATPASTASAVWVAAP